MNSNEKNTDSEKENVNRMGLSGITETIKNVHIHDIINKNVIPIMEKDTLDKVLQLFIKHNYHSYPVINENRELVGTIDQDLILEILAFDLIPKSDHTHLNLIRSMGEDAASIMIPHPLTIPLDTNLPEIIKLMLEHHTYGVYVIDKEQKLAGMISKNDIIHKIVAMKDIT